MLRKSDDSVQQAQYQYSSEGVSQSSSSDPKESIGEMTILPDELIVLILEWLKDRDIKAMSLTSNYFWDTCNKRFFDTLYGRSLRFSDWQAIELAALQNNQKAFDSAHQVIFFQPTNRTLSQNLYHYYMLAISSILLFLAVELGYFMLRIAIEGSKRSLPATIVANLLMIFVLVKTAYYGYQFISHLIQHTTHLNDTLLQSPMTGEHCTDLRQFMEANKIFLSPRLNQLVQGTTTISELLNFLRQEVTTLADMGDEFDSYLKSKRTSAKKFMDKSDVQGLSARHTELPAYAKHAVTLWSQSNNRKETLLASKNTTEEMVKTQSPSLRRGG